MIVWKIFMAIAGTYAGIKLSILGIKWISETFKGLDPKNFRKEDDEW